MISSKDVAKLAGVSQATVSRVLNNAKSVKPETRKKVLQAMEILRYQPNLIARSLVTNSTKTIALISGTLKNGFFVETTDSIINLATKHGYKTMVYFEGEAKLKDIVDTVMGNKVDGILMSS
ncbi:LacI family transcriptional regulator, partial [Anoxybacillus flavithermus]|nr:LacI family transcriptional regulator [Anoxybacillus flavithermus]